MKEVLRLKEEKNRLRAENEQLNMLKSKYSQVQFELEEAQG